VCGCNAAVKLLLSTGPQPVSEHPTKKNCQFKQYTTRQN